MGFPKEYIRQQVFKLIDELEDAYATLDQLHDSLDFDDQRQEDFAHDAHFDEHLGAIVRIIKSLGGAVTKGSLLDEHFDREAA